MAKKLTDLQYHVTQEKGTEPPFSGEYVHNKETGMYHCVVCDAPLFSSDTKFESNSGWPSFWDAVNNSAVKLVEDTSHGMHRTEVVCAKCGAHLGHVFDDGPKDKTGQRYCINSVAMQFCGHSGLSGI